MGMFVKRRRQRIKKTLLKMDFIEVNGEWVRKDNEEVPMIVEAMMMGIMGRLNRMEARQVRMEAQLQRIANSLGRNDEVEDEDGNGEMED